MDDHQEKRFLAHLSENGEREQTVLEHLSGTAGLAAGFAEPFGGERQARLAGMLHDIGKYSDAFQNRLHGGSKVDHATAGAKEAAALKQWEAAFAVIGHHSGLPDYGSRTDTADAGTFRGRLKKTPPPYDRWKREVKLPEGVQPPSWARADTWDDAFYIRMLYSCLVDADYLDTEAFMRGEQPRGGYASIPVLLQKLERHISGWWDAQNDLNRKRCEVLRRCIEAGRQESPGLFSLTVPTGGGKTVSSLAFALHHAAAHGMERVIYVIPYTSIIDQTADVFSDFLGAENVLEHHAGVDYTVPKDGADKADAVDARLLRKALATENWDAPVVVTTAVQFFESLYANRSSRCRKLHNLARSVIIFDEAQTLPVRYLYPCVYAIGELVRHYGATAVLCTATQPALEEMFRDLSGLSMWEIVPDTEGLYRFFRRTTLSVDGQIAKTELADTLSALPQALCVVNRRATARELYGMLEGEGRFCLTTLLYPADRKRKLKEIRERLRDGRPCRVVSTSLIEAGVDLDFPAAWREEAGLDSILQTAGRCNREGKRTAEESIVHVFRLEGEKTPQMIEKNTASARGVFMNCMDPASPEAVKQYFEVFRNLKGEDMLDEKGILYAFQGGKMSFAWAAENFHLIDNQTVTVYIPQEECKAEIEALRQGYASRGLFRRLDQYAVNIYPEHVKKLDMAGALQPLEGGGYILTDPGLYDPDTGLKLDIETGRGLFV